MANMDQSQDCKLISRNDLLDSFNIVSSQYSPSSFGSGDESFVVLWKDGDNKSSKEVYSEPTSRNFVETKSLIEKLPMEIEQLSFANDINPQPRNDLSGDNDLSIQNGKQISNDSEMDQSLQLPNMLPIKDEVDTSGVISIPTLSNLLTPEEVEKRVSEIVEENMRLKDTILGNNSTMKLQYERIVKWQKDVQKVHETHKEKMMEAKDFIERLKQENSNMCREVEEMKGSKKKQEEEINYLKQSLKVKEDCNKENLNSAKDHKDAKELELKKKNSTVENTVLTEYKAKLICANNEIEEYKKEIDQLRTALQSCKMDFEEAKMESKKMQQQHEEKLISFNETIHSLSSQLLTTNRQQEMASIENQLESTQSALAQVTCSRAEAYAQIDDLNKKILELNRKLEVSQAQADEIFALKAQLELYKTDFDTERSAKEGVKVEKEKLSEDIQKLLKQNQQLQEKINSIRDNYYVVPKSREGQGSATSKPHSDDDPCFLQ